jgi:hypothetical protein
MVALGPRYKMVMRPGKDENPNGHTMKAAAAEIDHPHHSPRVGENHRD